MSRAPRQKAPRPQRPARPLVAAVVYEAAPTSAEATDRALRALAALWMPGPAPATGAPPGDEDSRDGGTVVSWPTGATAARRSAA